MLNVTRSERPACRVNKTMKKCHAVVKPRCLTDAALYPSFTFSGQDFLASHVLVSLFSQSLKSHTISCLFSISFICFTLTHLSGVHNLEAESTERSILALLFVPFHFFKQCIHRCQTKLTLKRDNGLYNLYVMYLMKDAKTIPVRYSIKEQTRVCQKQFNRKFQLNHEEQSLLCTW